jgi:hypothetical protein
VKGSNTFGQRYATQAATNRALANTASITVERYFTVTAEGNGESFNIQTNTPSAGNKIVRKIWYKDEAFEATDVDTWTLLHTFADDTTYANTATKWQEYLDGQANGTPPFTLAISWEDIPAYTGLLDSYSGAGVALSLRLLRSAYTGSAVRVRRASDNTEQDIGFDGNGDLDTSALTTFCTGTNGFIRTWYDQSGGGYHFEQTTTADQLKIYDSSAGVVTLDSKPAIQGSGNGTMRLVNSSVVIAQPWAAMFVVACEQGADPTQRVFQSINTTVILNANQPNSRWEANAGTGITISGIVFTQQVNVLVGNGAASSWTTNGSTGSAINIGTNGFNGLQIMGSSSAGFVFQGKVQEFVIWPSAQSGNLTGISDNADTYYSIY